MSTIQRLFVVALLLSACQSPAFAAGAAPAPSADVAVPPEIPDAISHHTLLVGGKPLAYTARAGTITLRNDQDQPTARIFYVAYTVEGSHRPVTFLYNGGPGSSTMWLHMGSFGPMRVETGDGTLTGPPPYRVVPNDLTLLDTTDLVFIDMPNTGFGRIVGAGKPKDFFDVDRDVQAFGQFIERYITAFSRWNSPKFLYGESYGTTRTGALVNYLQNDGVGFNGIILQSSFLNAGLDFYDDNSPIGGNDWVYAFYLPTEAASAWYHHALPGAPASLEQLLPDVEHFAMTEYMDALAKGAAISRSEYEDVVAKLHRYSGLSEQFVRNSNLRVPYGRFEQELFRNQGTVVGRLDGRFQTPTTDRPADQPAWDPTDAAIDYPFTTAVNQYIRNDLGYGTPLLYHTGTYDLIGQNGNWDSKHNGNPTTNVMPDLSAAMTYNPRLRVFSANGYYDFATPYFETVYALNHLAIEPSLQKNITYGFYESGHMIYLEPTSMRRLHDDLERWYGSALAGS
jgi:carboxypeptidase C (cathepsin A)